VLCAFLFISVAFARLKWHELTPSYAFETYLDHFGKSYDDAKEYSMRKDIFEANLAKVLAHNQDTTKTWKEEVNHLSDWTQEEFRGLLGYRKAMGYSSKAERAKRAVVHPTPIIPAHQLPALVDWRTKGVVTPVKDQGECGSCWSFATAETIESHFAINKSLPISELSEQQILDCTLNPKHCGGTGGCSGGTAEVAMDSIIKQGGLSSEWTYPYVSHAGKDGTKCNTPLSPVVRLDGYVSLPPNEYLPLLTAVATVGPISISVDASSWSFYATGVFNGCNKTNPDLDHAVQLVGYGTENGHDYWLVRNSWTTGWGESGYIKVMRTATVQCGIDLTPADGSGCDGGPANVTVCGTCGILYDNVYPLIK